MSSKIVEIKVRRLLGSFDLCWPLSPSVNILAGGNGSGKSTLLRAVAYKLRHGDLGAMCGLLVGEVDILTNGGEVEVLTNFDDWTTSAIDFSLSGVDAQRKALFFDILDRLFSQSGKLANRSESAGAVSFKLGSINISTAALSSGEKQVLRLFYSLLTSARTNVLILDEPEISLQFDWQKVLLEDMLRLSPDLQILVATHSPAIIMNGWVDCVSEISSLESPSE